MQEEINQLKERISELERVALKRNDYQSRSLIQEMIFIRTATPQTQVVNLGTGDGSATLTDNSDQDMVFEWKGKLYQIPTFNLV